MPDRTPEYEKRFLYAALYAFVGCYYEGLCVFAGATYTLWYMGAVALLFAIVVRLVNNWAFRRYLREREAWVDRIKPVLFEVVIMGRHFIPPQPKTETTA